jgi:predicted oxidoreductase (fatty acid repression mutant protein)
MVALTDIDLDSGCDAEGIVIVNDDGIKEIAAYFAAMANQENCSDWWESAEGIAQMAVYNALTNPDLIAKLYRQICVDATSRQETPDAPVTHPESRPA